MLEYLLCFRISVLFAYQAEKSKNKFIFLLFSLISILFPVILAALRDYSIGVDTSHYLRGTWSMAVKRTDSLSRFLTTYLRVSAKDEIVYAWFLWIIAKISNGSNRIFLFATQLVIVGGVYIGAFRLKHHANPAFTMLIFYLLYYHHSLNITRQYMAMSIIFGGG